MRDLLLEVPVPVVVVAREGGRILAVNRAFEEAFGFSCEDLADAPGAKLFGDEAVLVETRTWWARILTRHERTESREVTLRTKDGAVRHALASVNVLEDCAVVALADITERKRTEEQLRVSEERHRLLADNALDVVWTMSFDGRITYVSPSIEAMRGITPEVAMRQTIDQIHPPESAAKSIAYFSQLYADVQAGRPPQKFRGELEYKHADGSTVWTEVMAIPLLDGEGRLIEILGVTRDLRERKQAENAMRTALAENQKLVEELRTALQEVKTLSGLLPICMFCKKIRNDQGYWDRIETYLAEHTDIVLSHGLCQECSLEHYGV